VIADRVDAASRKARERVLAAHGADASRTHNGPTVVPMDLDRPEKAV
jgi:hypothetical protein